MSTAPLIACHECDLLQRETPLPRGGVARCGRCGATLYRSHPESLERTFALTVGAIMLFAIANAFPIVGLQLQGQIIQTTLFNTVRTLYDEDMKSVAALVFVTTIAMPALELFAMTYLLLPLRTGPGAAALCVRVPHAAGRAAVGHGGGVHARRAGVAGQARASGGRGAGDRPVVVRRADAGDGRAWPRCSIRAHCGRKRAAYGEAARRPPPSSASRLSCVRPAVAGGAAQPRAVLPALRRASAPPQTGQHRPHLGAADRRDDSLHPGQPAADDAVPVPCSARNRTPS